MKIIERIKKKIALRRERKAKLRKFADLIEFAQYNGHSYIDLNESLISRKALSANGIGNGAGLPYIWKDKEGNVHKSWNIKGKWYNIRKSACNAYKSWEDMKEDYSKLICCHGKL